MTHAQFTAAADERKNMSDDLKLAIAAECLRQIWQCFDAGGVSMGRSRQAVWLETAMQLIPYDHRFSNMADSQANDFEVLREDVRFEDGREKLAEQDRKAGYETRQMSALALTHKRAAATILERLSNPLAVNLSPEAMRLDLQKYLADTFPLGASKETDQ